MRRIIVCVAGVLLILLAYYLFIRPHEFSVRFEINTTPGDLIETARIWNRSLKDAEIVRVDSFYRIEQNVRRQGRDYKLSWHLEKTADSTLTVNVKVSEPGKELRNKLMVPFSRQPIEEDSEELVREYYRALKEHLRITRVRILGESQIDSAFCICRELQTTQVQKANGMMREFLLFTSFIADMNLKVKGPAMVRVREWKHSDGLLAFDFCFPIVRQASMPQTNVFVYKTFPEQQVLKAEFNGNYITSDRAWYALIEYAEKMGYNVNPLPIEYFHSNPTLGMNELEWKAEIFLPIK